MSNRLHILLTVFLSMMLSNNIHAQGDFYEVSNIQSIELFFSDPLWDYHMDTARYGADGYTMADSVRINGISLGRSGVKYKGNSSYDSSKIKNPIHIELDHYGSQNYQGYTDIKLGNGYGDPSMIREVLSYQILGHYMDAPKCNFARLYINNKFIGLFSNTESINKAFLNRHFYENTGVFFKCNPIITPSPVTKCNLKYLGEDSLLYRNYYELKSSHGWKELITLCDTISNRGNGIESVADLDKLLWMLAFNTVFVNLDSYNGAFCQNYYLYQDKNGRFHPIIWDLNMSFGGFPFAGNGASSLGSLTVSNMQQFGILYHQNDAYWPLIQAVAGNTTFKKNYLAHVQTILEDFLLNDSAINMALSMQNLIDGVAQSDTNAFFSYTSFKSSITSNIQNGSYTIPGIGVLMNGRKQYLGNLSEMKLQAPQFDTLYSSSSIPRLGSQIFIHAKVSDVTSLNVFYRFNKSDIYTQALMYDDGLHHDGASNDGVYGIGIDMKGVTLEYYFLAEGLLANQYYPSRAGFETLTINANVKLPGYGQIRINEFMADNKSEDVDESGQTGDWIELYNNSNDTLYLDGMYISDDYEAPFKYAFPNAAYIAPKQFKVVWADHKKNTSRYWHSNFTLSSEGEQIILTDKQGLIIDSVNYGLQTTDKSQALCPDGGNRYYTDRTSSFHASNTIFCETGIDPIAGDRIHLWPNPATKSITVVSAYNIKTLTLYNHLGQAFEIAHGSDHEVFIDLSSFNNGIYTLRTIDEKHQIYHNTIIITGK